MSHPLLSYTVKAASELSSPEYDGIVFVSSSVPGSDDQPEPIRSVLKKAASLDSELNKCVSVLEVPLPAARCIYSPTGPLTDYDDVRSFSDAAKKGVQRALKAGVKTPLLVLPTHPEFKETQLVTLLGALEHLYVPIQLREAVPEKAVKIKELGVWTQNSRDLQNIIANAVTFETGRTVARDIGGADPERMAPPRVEEYVRKVFEKSSISLEVISDQNIIDKEYPLFAAVDRAARVIERHRGRIIYLTYTPSGPVERTLYLVGKGVTYDTGGADIKYGGIMAGMSRDKCGAAAVAGFMKVVDILKPSGIQIVGAMPLVRNSVGANGYVADEVLTARSKVRVRVGNTDAEGRMIMADVLNYLKDKALKAPDPHLLTIATLTGHAVRTVGLGYTILMDNGPSRKVETAQNFRRRAEEYGDMVEVSTIRREDIAAHKGKNEGDDVHQCGNEPSSKTHRGHQNPAAFLLMSSGLDKHGLDSDHPLKYTHVDIAGSAGDLPKEPTGAPILGLVSYFLQGR